MNAIDPIIFFFILGVVAGLLRSELRLPSAIYEFLSTMLLLTIGLKGGIEMAKQPFGGLFLQIISVLLMGFILPLIIYPVLLKVGRFKRVDAASIAGHYGSVSVGTYAVAVAYLGARGVYFEEHMPLFVVLLEVPAIISGIMLAKGVSRQTQWVLLAREVFLGKSIVLLLGGLTIGWVAGHEGFEPLAGFFFYSFNGVLALFLMEMGLITARQIGSLRQYGAFILVFGIVVPLLFGLIGTSIGWWLGMSLGGTILLATLAGSCSYIAVPAAMRIAVPEANPTLSLTASLGVTFPFNVLIGISIYHRMAEKFYLPGG